MSRAKLALIGVIAFFAVALFGTPTFATESPVTSKATVKNSPDDGCPVWARDTFTRTTTITSLGEGKYKVAIKDEGTFVTQPGSKTPGDASKTIGAEVTGSINGTGEFTVTGTLLDSTALAALNGKTYDNGSYDCKSDVPSAKTTGNWPLKFFAAGATTTGIDPWTWTYATACEKRVESSKAQPDGNITGKVCPSPSPSASSSKPPTPKASTSPTVAASLPVTGPGDTTLLVSIGAGLLGLGTVVVLATKRRRKAFTAE